jgi:hypothetical protein
MCKAGKDQRVPLLMPGAIKGDGVDRLPEPLRVTFWMARYDGLTGNNIRTQDSLALVVGYRENQ